jgi:hypothetical protein
VVVFTTGSKVGKPGEEKPCANRREGKEEQKRK